MMQHAGGVRRAATCLTPCAQVTEQREALARYETLDNGKPISESLWDIVSAPPPPQLQRVLIPENHGVT